MKKKKKRKKWIWIILAVVIVIIGYFIVQGKKAAENIYTTATAARGDLDIYYSFSGNTKFNSSHNVITTQAWKLESINVQEGDYVHKGDVLYVVNQEDYDIALNQARSAITNAERSLSTTQANMQQQIAQAKTSMSTAQLSLNDAQATLDKTQALLNEGMVSQENYDKAKMAYDVALENYNAAETAYNLLVNKTSGLSIESARAQVSQAQDSYDSLIHQIGAREVLAEVDGIIANIYVDPDVKLNAGTLVMDITDTSSVKAVVKVDEYDYTTMQVGSDVTVYIDALGLEVPGKVTSIDLQATATNGLAYFNAEVEFENSESVLGGLSVEVKSLKASAKDSILLKMDVLQFDQNNQPYVLYKDEKGNIQSKYVTVGITDGLTVEILDGVSEGETLYYVDMSAYKQMMNMMGGN